MTLTSFGMAQRSRPSGHDSSPVIALWKDPSRGTREISLEPGAQGVLLTVCGARATRRSADGRWPVESGTHYFDVAVHQIRASDARSESTDSRSGSPTPRVIEVDDLTILTGWAEAVAEALAHTPARAQAVLADARPGAPWRRDLGIAEPSPRLGDAIDSIERALSAAMPHGGAPSLDALLFAVRDGQPGESALDGLARSVLRSTLEQLCTRQAEQADSPHRASPSSDVASSRKRRACIAAMLIGHGRVALETRRQCIAQRGSRADPELGEDPIQVAADRAVREIEAFSDLLVGQSGGREAGDLVLLRGERLGGAVHARRRRSLAGGPQLGGRATGPGGRAETLKRFEGGGELCAGAAPRARATQSLAVGQSARGPGRTASDRLLGSPAPARTPPTQPGRPAPPGRPSHRRAMRCAERCERSRDGASRRRGPPPRHDDRCGPRPRRDPCRPTAHGGCRERTPPADRRRDAWWYASSKSPRPSAASPRAWLANWAIR